MNETVWDYCAAHGIVLTRCRFYRKNDQAFVEQKNGAVVLHIVGYRRYEGLEAAAALAKLYASVRLFGNVFQPSFKLAQKERDGARVRKRYYAPATPCKRLIADPRTTDATRGALEALCVDDHRPRLQTTSGCSGCEATGGACRSTWTTKSWPARMDAGPADEIGPLLNVCSSGLSRYVYFAEGHFYALSDRVQNLRRSVSVKPCKHKVLRLVDVCEWPRHDLPLSRDVVGWGEIEKSVAEAVRHEAAGQLV